MINSKAIFDVLKKIASRSSEIRRSDPLPKKYSNYVGLQFKLGDFLIKFLGYLLAFTNVLIDYSSSLVFFCSKIKKNAEQKFSTQKK